MLNETKPAIADEPCACCGRKHRKLIATDSGHWVGKNCAADIRTFLTRGRETFIAFEGGDTRKADLITAMLNN